MCMKALTFFLLIIHSTLSLAQRSDTAVTTDNMHPRRMKALAGASAAGYGAGLAGLHYLWYKDSGQQPFRFFNDNAEWKQVDKAGHFFSSFHLSHAAAASLTWAGARQQKADLYGALAGFAILLPIEIFDGFSEAYGASAGDLLANAGGAAFFIAQKKLWHDVRIHAKFSAHHTSLAGKRPEVLGDNAVSRLLKDYNGQTYWLSIDTDKFTAFPKWLNFAVGYGADNMVFAREAPNSENGYRAYRQFYFAPDLDLTSVKTRKRTVKALLFLATMIKLPAPALELSGGSFRFRPLYF